MKIKTGIAVLVALIFDSGCSTAYKKVQLHDEDFQGMPVAIVNDVPFVEQTPAMCGPTALYMMTKAHQPNLKLDELTQITFSPTASGSFKQDMLAAARRLGMAPYKIDSLNHIFEALALNQPVLIFHTTEFFGKKYWHYSVLTGYSRIDQVFMVHIGPYPNHEMDISKIVGSWEEGGKWAYVIMPAQQISKFATYDEALDNSLAFLRLGLDDAAYQLGAEALKRWPTRYEIEVVMAEVLLKKNENKKALSMLKSAFTKNPKNKALKQKILELGKLH